VSFLPSVELGQVQFGKSCGHEASGVR
jgi:hypothetical protein